MHVFAVLLVSQPVGLALTLMLLPLAGSGASTADWAVGIAAGAAGALGLAAFYLALAIGTVSVVAPIGALGVAVPVTVGLAGGEEPAGIQLAGLVVAIAGVLVVSREEGLVRKPVARRSIGLALVSALGFGTFFTGLDIAAEADTFSSIAAARVGGVATVVAIVVAIRPPLRIARGDLPVLAVIGSLDILANALYAIASTEGLLPVVAVGGSLYPAFTILLAHLFLKERLRSAQWSGVALALVGVVLIAAGA